MKSLSKYLFTALAFLACSFTDAVGATTRPNSFMIQSVQAGSTTEIDDLKITDLDSGNVVYQNNFESASDATRGLNSYYWPQGGKDSDNYVLNGSKTRVENGKLILETTGFNQNGYGGYESHSEMEPSANLPRNFRIEFTARRLQWAGHFHFLLFRKVESDALGAYCLGGALSGSRSSSIPVDIIRMAASGNWFQDYGVMTNFGTANEGWAQKFSSPSGTLEKTHKLAVELQGDTVSFYLDDSLLKSTSVAGWSAETESTPKDFSYDLMHINQADAEKYLISSNNLRKYSEWQSPPVSYWGPSTNGVEGELVYKFPLGGNSTKILLKASDASWNGSDSFGKGCSMLEASRDGVTWVELKNSLNPRQWGVDWSYENNLPQELLGSAELWVRVKMYVENSPNSSYTVAQFGRSSSAAIEPVFSIRAQIYGSIIPDTTAPVITLNGENTQEVFKGSTYLDPGALVTDNVDATRTISGDGTVDTSTIGNYTITFTAQDSAGNVAEPVTRTVNVVLNPNFDEDGDGLTNAEEQTLGSDPSKADSDNDGVNDYREQKDGTDPNNAASYNALSKGLVAYYPFNGNANDESGNGNHATIHGATLSHDRFSNEMRSLSFDGIDDFVDAGDQEAFDFGLSDFSISVWIKSSTPQCSAYVVGKYSDYAPSSYGVGTDENGKSYAFAADALPYVDTRGKSNVGDSYWHCMTAVFDRDSELSIYFDGTLESTVNISGKSGYINNNFPFLIGKILSGQYFSGNIDDIRIYNRALSAAEVSQLYCEESGEPNMVFVEGGTLPMESILAGQKVESFNISRFETTGREWKNVCKWAMEHGYSIPGGYSFGDDNPILSVSWYDIAKWCNAKSEMDGLTPVYELNGSIYKTGESEAVVNGLANGYRLPSEKEWEWAARGGVKSQGYLYSGSNDPNEVAWHKLNSERPTYPVGLKKPNELGIYDMSGNIAERTNDIILLSNSIERIQRGGFTGIDPYFGRVTARLSRPSELRAWMGFRYAYNNRVLDAVDRVISLSEEPNDKVTSNQVAFSGIITEDSVVELQYRKGKDGAWVTIPTVDAGNGTHTWAQLMTLAPGFNHIEFQAVDEEGNVSAEFSRNITYVHSIPVGSYSGVSEGGQLEDDSEEARVLFKKTNGLLQVTTTSGGNFSGKLLMDGRRIPLKGTFSELGGAIISAKIGTTNCTVNLNFQFTEASSYIEGTLTGIPQSNNITFKSYPAAYTGKTGGIYPLNEQKVMFAASYLGGPSSDLVIGHGYGKMALLKDGSLNLAGRLADGSFFTASQRLVRGLNEELLLPIFVPLSASKALIKGQLSVNDGVGQSFASGSTTWVRSANPKTKIYPEGISAELWIESSLWNLAKGANLLTGNAGGANAYNITIDSNAWVLEKAITLNGIWSATNKPVLFDLNNQKVTLMASTTTGDFNGSCTVNFNEKLIPAGFQGQLFTTPLQSASGEILYGAGYMMLNGKSVPVEIITPF